MAKLLVSVRSAAEAQLALEAGVEVIDVKEPLAGALGAASPAVVDEVVRLVGGRRPTSFACGELLQSPEEFFRQTMGRARPSSHSRRQVADFVKVGLAGCGSCGNWTDRWRRFVAMTAEHSSPVAVIYADWQTARAPRPAEVIEQASSVGCRAVLIDTFDKQAQGLMSLYSRDVLAAWIEEIHARNMLVVIAGRLTLAGVARASQVGPDYVGVRGAVCSPDRNGSLDPKRLRMALAALNASRPIGTA
jgi:uncharacterized protein (UPF0264 family)